MTAGGPEYARVNGTGRVAAGRRAKETPPESGSPTSSARPSLQDATQKLNVRNCRFHTFQTRQTLCRLRGFQRLPFLVHSYEEGSSTGGEAILGILSRWPSF